MEVETKRRMFRKSTFNCVGESMTQQNFRDECSIDTIMKRFEKTGIIDHVAAVEGSYGHFLEAPVDYHTAMNIVVEAQEMFMTVPAKIRERFGNDPGAFLAFVEDPENEDELVKLGLANARRPEPAPGPVEPAPAPTPQAPPSTPEPAEPGKPAQPA